MQPSGPDRDQPQSPANSTPAQVPPAIIFDFDGTIADTFRLAVNVFERLTGRPGIYGEEEINRLRGLGGLQLLRELHIHPWKVPFLLIRGRAMMRRSMGSIKLFPGIETLVADLTGQGAKMYIISSNSTGNIMEFLERHGMDEYFIRVYGNVGLFSKARVLRKVMAGNHLDPSAVTYVGDEARDVEAARRAGIRCVAVGWGYNTPELLSTHEPSVVARTPQALAKALKFS